MTDFTPTTERVRDRYRHSAEMSGSNDPDPYAAFDHWLRKVQADVLRREAARVSTTSDAPTHWRETARWLQQRADRIERGDDD